LDLQLTMQSVPVATKVVSLNPAHGEPYSIQHYVIKFVSDLLQVGDFLQVLQFPPSIKLTSMIQVYIVEHGVKHHHPLTHQCRRDSHFVRGVQH
jgi:hypothetical protein